MTADGPGVGVRPAATDQDERLAELLDVVLETNPFQQARIEELGLGERPSLSELHPLTKRELVADQERHPSFRHQPHLPAGSLHPALSDQRDHRPARSACSRRPRTGTGGARASPTRTGAAGLGSPATASRSPSRSARTFSSGPPRRGSRRSARWRVSLGGMSSVQRLQTLAEVEATALWCTPTYALRLLRGRCRAAPRIGALESVEQVLCTGEPGALAARPCAPESRRASAATASITPG